VTGRAQEAKGPAGRRRGTYLLVAAATAYLAAALLDPLRTAEALKFSGYLGLRIAPIMILVIIFMGLMNHFIAPKTVSRYLGRKSGLKGWALATAAGIISHGPMYVWFPLIQDLRSRGMSNGLVAVFLCCRAIKVPLLPVMLYYFGWLFVVLLTGYTLLAGIAQGIIMDRMTSEGV